MIEAVNSVLANASLLRNISEQSEGAAARIAQASAPSSEASIATLPQAPYISPYVSVDVNFDTAVLQIRNPDTGDVVRQFPSESTLESRRRVEVARAALSEQARNNEPVSTNAPQVRTQQPSDSASASESTAPDVRTDVASTPSAPTFVAEAQVAAAALSASASVGGQQGTGRVSVTA